MERLAAALPIRILAAEKFGIPGDAKEAVLFAVLAYHTLKKIPANLALRYWRQPRRDSWAN